MNHLKLSSLSCWYAVMMKVLFMEKGMQPIRLWGICSIFTLTVLCFNWRMINVYNHLINYPHQRRDTVNFTHLFKNRRKQSNRTRKKYEEGERGKTTQKNIGELVLKRYFSYLSNSMPYRYLYKSLSHSEWMRIV